MDHAAVATRPTSDSLDIPGRQYFSDNRRADLNKCTIIIREKNEGVAARRGVAWSSSFYRNLASVASKAKFQRYDDVLHGSKG